MTAGGRWGRSHLDSEMKERFSSRDTRTAPPSSRAPTVMSKTRSGFRTVRVAARPCRPTPATHPTHALPGSANLHGGGLLRRFSGVRHAAARGVCKCVRVRGLDVWMDARMFKQFAQPQPCLRLFRSLGRERLNPPPPPTHP